MTGEKRVAIYVRTSTTEQTTENQTLALMEQAKREGLTIHKIYSDNGASGKNGDRKEFLRMLADADDRRFDVLLIWSLDRLTREGISNMLAYIERFKRNKIAVKSLQESWLDTTDEGVGQLILTIFAWVAKQERLRIIERTKAGLNRARAQGKTLGRPVGAKDTGRRRLSGYYNRWLNNRPIETSSAFVMNFQK